MQTKNVSNISMGGRRGFPGLHIANVVHSGQLQQDLPCHMRNNTNKTDNLHVLFISSEVGSSVSGTSSPVKIIR